MGSWTQLYTDSLAVWRRGRGYMQGPVRQESSVGGPACPDCHFVCPSCGDRSIVRTLCPRCDVSMEDVRAPSPGTRFERHRVGRAHQLSARRIRTRLALRARRRRVQAALDAAGPVCAISEAPGGLVHLRGRVHVIDPVSIPGPPVGAYVRHRIGSRVCACRPGCRAIDSWLIVESAVGTLALVDGTGVARIRAGDGFAVWSPGGVADEPALWVRQGDWIDVVAVAHAGRVDAPSLSLAGYRDETRSIMLAPPSGGPGWILAPDLARG